MEQAKTLLSSVSPWVIVALVLGVVLVVVAGYLLYRSSQKKPEKPETAEPPKPPKPRALRRVWGDFVARLSDSAQGLPVTVVLGERRSGKTSATLAGLSRSGASLSAPVDTTDPRLSMFAGPSVLVQEISGELLEDTRPEARSMLADLWRSYALRLPLVVVVVDTRSSTYTPAGLRRLGSLARDVVDRLTSLRGRPPRVRLVLTRLDERLEGFVPLGRVAEDEGYAARCLEPAGRRASDLEVLLSPLEPCLSASIRTLPGAQTAAVTRLLSGSGGATFAALEPLLDSLFSVSTGVAAPTLDGIVLSGLPDEGDRATVGDMFALDGASVRSDYEVHEKRRTYRAIAAGVLGALGVLGLYYWHWTRVTAVPSEVERFAAVRSPRTNEVDQLESQAGDALRSALLPRYYPLRLAYPKAKSLIERFPTAQDPGGEREAFVTKIRDIYLLPTAKVPSLPVRLYVVALLRSSHDSKLGKLASAEKETFARILDVPLRLVEDYVDFSYSSWQAPIDGLDQGIPRGDWDGFLTSLDTALRDGVAEPETIKALDESAKRLSDALRGIDDAPAQKELEALLRSEAPLDADKLLGPGDSRKIPDWVEKKHKEMDGLLTEVQGSTFETADVSGKTLRQIVNDLDGMKCPSGEAVSKETYPIDKDRIYRAEAWDRVVASSRSSAFVKKFVKDVTDHSRSPFFGQNQVFPSVGLAELPGRGASRALLGLYTVKAVEQELVPALTKLDGALTAACVSQAARDDILRLVRDSMNSYATAYHTALMEYVRSFVFSSGSLAAFRSDLQDMATPASWFSQFWTVVAENAAVDSRNDPNLSILRNTLRTFDSIVALQGEKGKFVVLDKYYAILVPYFASLEEGQLGPAGSPLVDRLSPLGKLGLTILDPSPTHPLPQVKAWLDGARIPGGDLRAPFLSPVNQIYERALESVERAVETAYTREVRPIIAPIWAQFPFTPDATAEVLQGELLAVLGVKGTLKAAYDLVVTPVVMKADGGAYLPKRPADYRSVRVSSEALALGKWQDGVNNMLFDEAGKPKSFVLSVQPIALPLFEKGDTTAITKSFWVVGDTRIEGFNQTAAWKDLPVPWSTAPLSLVGVNQTDPTSGEVTSRTRPGSGDLWQVLRLICQANLWAGETVSWAVGGTTISYLVKPDPWVVLNPPSSGRRCPSRPKIEPKRTAEK